MARAVTTPSPVDPAAIRRRAWLGVIVLGGAILRFATLDARSFWYDEAATVRVVDGSVGHMLSEIPAREGTPPLYYLLAWVWTQAFGTGEVGLRSLSAVLGTLTIPVAYAAARRAVSARAGLVAALLAAVSPPLVWFAQDARTYALAVLLAGLSFVAMLRARETGARRDRLLWALAATLAIGAHYFAAFAVAAEAAVLLAPRASRRALLPYIAVPAAAAAALAVLARAQRDHGGAFIHGIPFVQRLGRFVPEYVIGFQPPFQIALALVAGLLLLAIGWLLWRRTDAAERAGARLGAIVGGTAVVVPILLAVLPRMDYVLPRNTMTAWVPLAVVAAAGLGARRAGAAGAATLAAVCALSLVVNVVTAGRPKFDHDDWRGAARLLGRCDTDRVLVSTPHAGGLVLPLYLPGTRPVRPGERLVVGEVAAIGLPPSFRRIGVRSEPPRPATPPAPAGFTAASRAEGPTSTIVRYRAPRPRQVTPAALSAVRLTAGEYAALLVQRCAPDGR